MMLPETLAGLRGFIQRAPTQVALDLVDIALVAFLIYRVLVLLKGTRAMQTGVGLALVFVIYHAARRFGLITLWTMLDTLLTYIVLIIVVIFQNDIRRALMRVGQRRFLRGPSMSREHHLIDAVVKACTSLVQKRIGALIVFERDASLEEFIEPGVELDAVVTKELLYSIFVPSYENPMHDGAVILREGRLWQAGAFLPLTVSPKLDRTLGTRHRAAIGISEETDAVVVVVSEERGAISVCFSGNIVRNLDANSLREALLGLFHGRNRKKRSDGARRSVLPARPSTLPRRERSSSVPSAPSVDLRSESAPDLPEGKVQ